MYSNDVLISGSERFAGKIGFFGASKMRGLGSVAVQEFVRLIGYQLN